MKIEWLNEDKTRARITVGWLRKKQATLVRAKNAVNDWCWWYEAGKGTELIRARDIEDDLEQAMVDALIWSPVVGALPAARVVPKSRHIS